MKKLPQPRRSGRAWTSFIANTKDGTIVRGLHEQANPRHRLRVEHDPHTLFIHLSGEETGMPWTTLAVDRATRRWAVAQAHTQAESARGASHQLYESKS
ncbi:MAG TPA: hypothetical protein VFF73_01275 [Planctomycetota bacterium]|nr:hypothetical protein [Planctomycetota bacterium]